MPSSSPARRTAIVGIGETPPARNSGRDSRELALEAVLEAVADSGLRPSDIDGLVTDSIRTPHLAPMDWMGAQLGTERRWSGATSVGGAGIMTMAALAGEAIASGRARHVVAYYAYDGGVRPGGPGAYHARYPAKTWFEMPYGFLGQPGYFALWARRYCAQYPRAAEALAELSVIASEHGALTDRAQRPQRITLEDYWDSPFVADPVRLRDCCCISDGAGAFVMTSMERARDLRKPPVTVLASAFCAPALTPEDAFTQTADMLTLPGASPAAKTAFAQAGLTPADISFAEIYDCFTISLLIQIEDLGLCPKGEAADFVLSGATRLGGACPVNTHGGFLTYSYRLGIEHVTEAVRQLRGEAGLRQVPEARHALLSGLSMPDFGAMILGAGA